MDVYKIVTDRIIEKLEQGYIPWRKPWFACDRGAFNRVSKRPYSLLNQLLLQNEGEYATFKQWEQLGGRVKQGAQSEIVVFWKMQEIEEKNEDGEVEKRNIPYLRYYRVFHISQIDNVEPLQKAVSFDTEPIEKAESVLKQYLDRENIALYEGSKAFYRPVDDSITLPNIRSFKKAEEYYSVAFHECSHSTLKEWRCDREADMKDAHFGNERYSKEELIAEISSACILHSLGIETESAFSNSCAYIQNWLSVLKNDKKMIVSAAGKAEKAAKYIMNEI